MSPAEAFAWAVKALVCGLPDVPVIYDTRRVSGDKLSLVVEMPEAFSSEASPLSGIRWNCQIDVHAVSGRATPRVHLLALAERAAEVLFAAGGHAVAGSSDVIGIESMSPRETYTIRVTAPEEAP